METRRFNISANESNIDSRNYGISCLCAYGTHINGGWCALLTYGVSVELESDVTAVAGNRNRIYEALLNAPLNKEWLPKGDNLKLYAQELSETITKNIRGYVGEIGAPPKKKSIMTL